MLKQTLYCSGNVTDSQKIWNGLIGADPVRLVNDSRSEKNVFFFINFLHKYLQLLDIPVYCTVNKRCSLVISKIISISGDPHRTLMSSAVKHLQILTEKRKKKAQSDSAALQDVGCWRLLWP